MPSDSHLAVAAAHWNELAKYRSRAQVPIIDGRNFSLASVVSVARFRIVPELTTSEEVLNELEASATMVAQIVAESALAGNQSMYGTTTGFGGSGASTRITTAVPKLQRVLIKGLQSGITLPVPTGLNPTAGDAAAAMGNRSAGYSQDLHTLNASSLIMPEEWVKGAVAIRMNSLIRGHSGIRLIVIESMIKLLKENITPCPPLRQTISASGDLGPLAYIAGSLTGDNDCLVWEGEGKERHLTTAPLALKQHSLAPLSLLPKEGLAIVNGTAPSCSVAACTLHDAHFALLLSQATTALCVEALLGTAESFLPFIGEVARPHPGQIEVARNVRNAISGSALVRAYDERSATERLRQDRYSLRTAPQWLGPQVEELSSAHRTLDIEINATTDNPMIDRSKGLKGNINGGNFQGTSLTVAMEKIRIGLQHVGRIAYAQVVELGSPGMSRGLPPDLAASEPSLDYGQKALDMACSAYLAELSFVSNTVSNHVQAAEMHNQSVNSLAMVSARYTAVAVQLTQMILANLLLSLCQAVDLRAMYARFFTKLEAIVQATLAQAIAPSLSEAHLEKLSRHIINQAKVSFGETSWLDTEERFVALCRPLLADVHTFLRGEPSSNGGGRALSDVHAFDAGVFHDLLASSLAHAWVENREAYFRAGSAEELLGHGTRKLYCWVRHDLGLRMRGGIDVDSDSMDVHASKIYEGIANGEVNAVLLGVFGEKAATNGV